MTYEPFDPQYTPAVNAAMSAQRRRLASLSPKHFAHIYLSAEFNKPPSRMHTEVFEKLLLLHATPGARLAVVAPRGHAKSTVVTLAYALWAVLVGKEQFVVVASGTEAQSSRLLEHIRKQLEENRLLRMDFPQLATASRNAPWRRNSLLIPGGGMLMAFSTLQNLRGIRHREHRPTLILCDDLEDRNSVIVEEQRHKLGSWFDATLLKAGTPETRVVVVGNILHHDSLMANLLANPTWQSLRYRAIEKFSKRPDQWDFWGRVLAGSELHEGESGPAAADGYLRVNDAAMHEGTQVLWPERYSYKELMLARLSEGEGTFQAEFQNDPNDPESCVFARTKLTYWDEQPMTVDEFLRRRGFRYGEYHGGDFFGACDPSLGGNPQRGDYTAIVVLFRPEGSKVKYVVAADIERRTPDQTLDRIVQLGKIFPMRTFAVEGNQFQSMLFTALKCRMEAETLFTRVELIHNRTNKQQRILGIQPEISQGLLVFSKKHQRLLEQMRGFPTAKHDDGPDALEMALTAAKRDYRWYRIQI
ncbi:MAG: phage terminase large subunit [Phycisphaerales bacterium]|nr:phage terminase large subunit [Phycisphaerales bacterium]